MDPSQQPPDSDNDEHSLETSGGQPVSTPPAGSSSGSSSPSSNPVQEESLEAPDTPGGSDGNTGTSAPPPIKKPSLFKRLWKRLNIYFLLFVLVVLVAVTVVIVLTINSKKVDKQNAQTLNSQSLSENTLKQLANSTATIGSLQQTLTVQSNAIFAGTVLVRSNLAVAGTLQVGGDLVLPGITVSGNSRFGQVQADTVTVASTESVQGTLTVKNGLSVTGNSNFNGGVSATQITTGTLQLNGDLVLTHHITAGGAVPGFARGSALGAGGTSSVSGSDTAGTIIINTGSGAPAGCFATVTFATPFSGTPHVVVTPVGSAAAGLAYYINRSSTNFSLCSASPPPSGTSFGFDYFVVD